MQLTLLDFTDAEDKDRLLARIRARIKEVLGDKLKIEKIEICRKCSKRGIVTGRINRIYKKKYIHLAGNEPLLGIYQETLTREYSKEVKLSIEIYPNEIRVLDIPIDFISGLCPQCYIEEREKVLNKAIDKIQKFLEHKKVPLPPFEAYKIRDKFVIELPRRKFIFTKEEELKKLIRDKIIALLTETLEAKKMISLNDLMKEIKRQILLGNWKMLEILVLISNLSMRKKTHKIKNFDDVLALIAYVEKKSIENLKNEIRKYGMALTTDNTVGFSQKEIFPEDALEDAHVIKIKDSFIHGDIVWKINGIYFNYLKPVKVKKYEKNILVINTKYAVIYLAPSY